jgi:hypothetical protein
LNRVKHPSTPYLNISPSQGRTVVDAENFVGYKVTVTEKMDGEIATLYPDGYYHPRSLTHSPHWSRDIVHALIPGILPAMRVNEIFVFENMYARHTIEYNDLGDYLYLLYVVRQGRVVGFKETQKIADRNGLVMPSIIFSGRLVSTKQLKTLTGYREGYVIRPSETFEYYDIATRTAKYVVTDFIQNGEEHWTTQEPTKNRLRCSESNPP